MDDLFERSLARHRETRGKIEVRSRMRLDSSDDLSLAYTPGVARPCEAIAADPTQAWELTWKGRTVAVVSDGSAVLGLGDIGPLAALPVMEGKAALFREFAGVDAVPIVLDAREPDAIVATVTALAPTFGGINLEDISAPRCFEIEARLQDVGIPVLHDDQHGTAIVLLAALMSSTRVVGRPLSGMTVVINGAGAAGRAIARLVTCVESDDRCIPVGRVLVCDSKGIIAPGRAHMDPVKEELARLTNADGLSGSLRDALRGADVFIGVSRGNLLRAADVRTMAADPIVLAMANPTPEIDPDEARAGGAAIVGTGRSDHPNQVNNVLAFPGLFRGALEARASRFTNAMKFAAVEALTDHVREPTPGRILPEAFDRSVAVAVAKRVAAAARASGVARSPEV
jgi:malate dehydrogenase (oxaloacetate-decarboxylating)